MTEEAEDLQPAKPEEETKPRRRVKKKPAGETTAPADETTAAEGEPEAAKPETKPAVDPRGVRIRNALNVYALDFPLPAGGGLVVLEGLNGSGKSNALRALQAGLEGDGSLPLGDPTETAFVEVAGVRCEMGRRKRRGYHDDLTLRVIDQLDDPRWIVDPKIEKDEAADADRIKRLARMLRLEAHVEPFLPLLANPRTGDEGREELDRLLTPELQASAADLPELAGRIKRACEKEALLAEGEVAHLDAELEAIARGVEPVAAYLQEPCDEKVLAEAHEQAVRALDRAERHNELAVEAGKARRSAELTLQEAEARGMPDPEALRREVAARKTERDAAVDEVAARKVRSTEAREAVKAAREALRLAELEYENRIREEGVAGSLAEAAKQALTLAEDAVPRAETAIKALSDVRATFEAALPTIIEDDELLELRALVDEAAGNMVRGAAVREAHKRLAQRELVLDKREEVNLHGRRLRDAAAGVEVVLSDIVSKEATQSLLVQNGRLYVTGRPRGAELFSELSWGERWFLVYVVLLHATGRGGIVLLPQEAFEGLDPENVKRAARLAVDLDVVVVTARPTTGPLCAVLLDAEGEVLRRIPQPIVERQGRLGEGLATNEGGVL